MTFRKLAASLAIAAALLAGCGVAVDRAADRSEAEAEAAYPPIGQFVEVDGRRVHVVIEGSGPDLVLIHGASGNARDFTFSFIDKVKDRYRVLAFDRPGLGYTDRVSPRYAGAVNSGAESPIEQALLLQAAAARLGATRPIVLGQSYGGAVAMAWALERPENVAGLVIVSGATEPWPGQLAPQYPLLSTTLGASTIIPLVTAALPMDRAALSLAAIFAPQAPPEGYAEHVGIGLALRRETLRANFRQINTLKRNLKRMAPRYGEITLPVEIIHGEADRIVHPDIHSETLHGQLANSRLTLLPGMGHMPHHTAEATVIAVLDRLARALRLHRPR